MSIAYFNSLSLLRTQALINSHNLTFTYPGPTFYLSLYHSLPCLLACTVIPKYAIKIQYSARPSKHPFRILAEGVTTARRLPQVAPTPPSIQRRQTFRLTNPVWRIQSRLLESSADPEAVEVRTSDCEVIQPFIPSAFSHSLLSRLIGLIR